VTPETAHSTLVTVKTVAITVALAWTKMNPKILLRRNYKMTNEITYVSMWEHKETGRRCRIINKKREHSRYSDFSVGGYNPLPCVSFVSSYTIVAAWLRANGWERVADVSRPDTIIRVTR
jgi:hypothetical protein